MKIHLIWAQDNNGGIGQANQLPWKISEDLKHFKKLTLNSTVIMGRKTWDSLPIKPLPNRRNIILSRNTIANIETYKKIFADSLSLNNSKNIEELRYNIIPEWNSIGYMSLIAALDEDYKFSLETDDNIDFSSFKKGIEILRNYEVLFLNEF